MLTLAMFGVQVATARHVVTVVHAVLVAAMMKTVAHAVSVRAVTVVQAVEPCNF